PPVDTLLAALATLHVRGHDLDWSAFFNLFAFKRIPLPTYAFQRERFWREVPRSRTDVASAGLGSADHPPLGAAVSLADADGLLLTGRVSLTEHPWLAGHVVFDTVILPGTAFLELALIAAHRVGLERVEELVIEAPLPIPPTGGVQLQLSVGS